MKITNEIVGEILKDKRQVGLKRLNALLTNQAVELRNNTRRKLKRLSSDLTSNRNINPKRLSYLNRIYNYHKEELDMGIDYVPPQPPQPTLYRNTIVRTYYADGANYSNREIADFRIEQISSVPLTDVDREELIRKADRMEWTFKKIKMAKAKGKVRFSVSGEEKNVKIDFDEGKAGVNRQVSFMGGKYVYDDSKISRIENDRSIEYRKYKDRKRLGQ